MKKLMMAVMAVAVMASVASASAVRPSINRPAGTLIQDDPSWNNSPFNGAPMITNLTDQIAAQNRNYITAVIVGRTPIKGTNQLSHGYIQVQSEGLGTVQYNAIVGKNTHSHQHADDPLVSIAECRDSGLFYDRGEASLTYQQNSWTVGWVGGAYIPFTDDGALGAMASQLRACLGFDQESTQVLGNTTVKTYRK